MTTPRHYRWDRILAVAGLLSWLIAIVYVLLTLVFVPQAWSGLSAFVYAAEFLFWSHCVLTLVMIAYIILRAWQRLPIGRWLWWGLGYYLGLPLLVFGVLLWTQGGDGTIVVLRYLLRRFS
jgi:hypothetical protein